MSIRGRVEDAKFLWQHARREGAFLCALSAVAATARLRYPDRKAVKDSEAFKQFMLASLMVRLSVEFRGELHSIEQIFYKWLRCELVHEGGLPVDIQFMPGTDLSFALAGRLSSCSNCRRGGSIIFAPLYPMLQRIGRHLHKCPLTTHSSGRAARAAKFKR